jgi:hypothetical protein
MYGLLLKINKPPRAPSRGSQWASPSYLPLSSLFLLPPSQRLPSPPSPQGIKLQSRCHRSTPTVRRKKRTGPGEPWSQYIVGPGTGTGPKIKVRETHFCYILSSANLRPGRNLAQWPRRGGGRVYRRVNLESGSDPFQGGCQWKQKKSARFARREGAGGGRI